MASPADVLHGALVRHERSVRLPGPLDDAEVQRLVDRLSLDDPELFFVEGLAVRRPLLASGVVVVEPAYRFDAARVQRMLRALDDAVAEPVRRARAAGGFEAVRILHDWLIGRFSYGETRDGLDHEAPGPLLFGAGVCDGVAKAFKLLCDRAGVPCLAVTGTARDRTSPAQGAYGPHAWNLVQVEGSDGAPGWFHADVTFDAALTTSVPRRDYLCIGDAEIARDHRVGADPLPPCPRSWGYYEGVGCFAGTRSALLRMAREAGRRGERALVFQLPFLEGADDDVLASLAAEAARELAPPSPRAPRQVRIAPNASQMVCQVDVV